MVSFGVNALSSWPWNPCLLHLPSTLSFPCSEYHASDALTALCSCSLHCLVFFLPCTYCSLIYSYFSTAFQPIWKWTDPGKICSKVHSVGKLRKDFTPENEITSVWPSLIAQAGIFIVVDAVSKTASNPSAAEPSAFENLVNQGQWCYATYLKLEGYKVLFSLWSWVCHDQWQKCFWHNATGFSHLVP